MSLSPERQKQIGCSDIAKILGVSPWGSAWDVWARIKLGAASDQDNSAKARGRRMESLVIDDIVAATGLDPALRCNVGTLTHPAYPWFAGTPDAMFACHPNEGIEAKTANQRDGWGEPCTIEAWSDEHVGRVPSHYMLQVYGYLLLTGASAWHIGVGFTDWNEGILPARVYTVLPDPTVQESILAHLVAWHDRYIVGDEEPPIDGSAACTDVLSARFPGRAEKLERDATADEADLIRAYAETNATIKALTATKDELGNKLRAAIGDSYRLKSSAGQAVLTLASSRRSLSLGAVEKHPDILALVEARNLITVGAPSRSLTVK